MSYPIYYNSCPDDLPDHLVEDCPVTEHGRVRSVAFIRSSYLYALLVDPTDSALWQTGILNKDIIIIPATSGAYDGGTTVEGPGYGNQETAIVGAKHVVNYKDPDYKINAEFYNAMKYMRQWHFAFVTETLTHIFESGIATVLPKAPVQDDMNSEVVWEVEVRVSQPDSPVPIDTPAGVFESFNYV